MSEAKNTQENETESDVSELRNFIPSEMHREILSGLIETNPPNRWDLIFDTLIDLLKHYDTTLLLQALGERNAATHGVPNKTTDESVNELANDLKNFKVEIIPLSINVKPLTPQTLALAFSALTELTTKLWLIARHRFADLIEYTQTRDVRFANEAGSTITYVTYNSPFSFGLQVDKVVPGIADAIMTIVDGLSQRKAKQQKLEIDNLIALTTTKAAEEQLKKQQDMSELERQQQEIKLEKQRLFNEKIRQELMEQRLGSQIKQVEQALELAGKAVDIVYPNADPEMRPVLLQTLVNNILQIDSVEGLQIQLALPEHSSAKPPI